MRHRRCAPSVEKSVMAPITTAPAVSASATIDKVWTCGWRGRFSVGWSAGKAAGRPFFQILRVRVRASAPQRTEAARGQQALGRDPAEQGANARRPWRMGRAAGRSAFKLRRRRVGRSGRAPTPRASRWSEARRPRPRRRRCAPPPAPRPRHRRAHRGAGRRRRRSTSPNGVCPTTLSSMLILCAGRHGDDAQAADARAQLLDVCFGERAVRIVGRRLDQVVLERRQRAGVVPQLVLRFADVEQHDPVGRQRVCAPRTRPARPDSRPRRRERRPAGKWRVSPRSTLPSGSGDGDGRDQNPDGEAEDRLHRTRASRGIARPTRAEILFMDSCTGSGSRWGAWGCARREDRRRRGVRRPGIAGAAGEAGYGDDVDGGAPGALATPVSRDEDDDRIGCGRPPWPSEGIRNCAAGGVARPAIAGGAPRVRRSRLSSTTTSVASDACCSLGS